MADNFLEPDDDTSIPLVAPSEQMPGLAGHIRSKFEDSENGRFAYEQRWIQAYKNFRGIYDSTTQYRDSEKTKAKVEVNADGNEVELKLIYDAEWIAPTTLKGKLEKDRIVGKASYYAKDEVDWKAIRFLSLEEVTGKWQMTFTTPDGTERTPKFQLNEKDGKPEIKLIPDEGETDTAGSKVSNVKYKDGLLLFEVELDFQGQELNLEYELEFETSKTLVGSMFFSLPGIDQTGEVDLDGEKIK